MELYSIHQRTTIEHLCYNVWYHHTSWKSVPGRSRNQTGRSCKRGNPAPVDKLIGKFIPLVVQGFYTSQVWWSPGYTEPSTVWIQWGSWASLLVPPYLKTSLLLLLKHPSISTISMDLWSQVFRLAGSWITALTLRNVDLGGWLVPWLIFHSSVFALQKCCATGMLRDIPCKNGTVIRFRV